MAPTDTKEKGNTKWTSADEATLVEALLKEKRKANWGDNNPKPTAYTAVELALAGSEKVSGGVAKGVLAIKSRWQRLKQEFDIVKKLRGLSGFGWDDERKVVTASPDVWEAYIEKHPKAKPWRKKAFPLYDDISELVDGSRATGENTFRAGQTNSASGPSPPSPVIDPILLAESSLYDSPESDKENFAIDTGNIGKMPKAKRKKPDSDEEDSSDARTCKPTRAKSQPKTGYERRKMKRVSAGEGLTTVARSMQTAMETLAASITGGNSGTAMNSPARKAAAVSAIEQDEGLSETEFDMAVDMLMSSSNAATMYLAIKNPKSRSRFLQSQLSKHRASS